jgi:type IX secretion system PorP/SprF family membrane protein
MKNLILITLLVVCTSVSKSQQLEQWTQFYLNEYTINPAVAGSDKYFHANAMFRNQWSGITDAPRTYYMSVQGPIVKDNMGIGGSVFSDVLGPLSKTGLQLSYAYHLKLNQESKLSFSLAASIFQWAVNGSELNLENQNDIALSGQNMSVVVPDFGFGIRYSMKNFHVGAYLPQITSAKIRLFDDYSETKNELDRHYYLNAGYRYDINDDFAVEGNYFARFVHPIFMNELQVRGIYKEMVWLGSSVRMPVVGIEGISAICFMAGYQFENNMTIGYSYDLDLGKVGNVSNGSHEILVGIRFSKKNPKPLIPAADL